jgi:hypothetical protein
VSRIIFYFLMAGALWSASTSVHLAASGSVVGWEHFAIMSVVSVVIALAISMCSRLWRRKKA